MKNLLVLFIGLLFVTFGYSQRSITDTLQGNETVNFEEMQGATVVQALCTQLGGTSDGTLTLYGSVDGTSYVFINGVGAELLTASPKASITGADLNQITITDGLVASWVINGDPYPYYRIKGAGTASDTTKITIKWSK